MVKYWSKVVDRGRAAVAGLAPMRGKGVAEERKGILRDCKGLQGIIRIIRESNRGWKGSAREPGRGFKAKGVEWGSKGGSGGGSNRARRAGRGSGGGAAAHITVA